MTDDSQHISATLKDYKISLYKQYRFQPQVEEFFTRTQADRDKVIFSLLRNNKLSLLNELALSIREGEVEFSSAAIRWSEGPESATAGRVGPIPAHHAGHPEIQKRLLGAKEGDIIGPFPINGTHVLLRLETRIHCKLDEQMESLLIDELYHQWFPQEIAKLERGETIEPIEYLPD